jgi:hypothetical protein
MRLRSVVLMALGAAVVLATMLALRNGASPHKPTHTQAAPAIGSPVAAAAAFLAGLTLPRITDDARRRRYLEQWATPQARSSLLATYADEGRKLNGAFVARPRVSRAAFIGYRLASPSSDVAVVTVWAVAMGGSGTSPVAVGLRTIRIALELVGRKWKVASVREIPGPSQDLPLRQFKAAADGFKAFHVAP